MILGIDIGATKTWLAFLDGGRIVNSRKISTQKEPAQFLRDLFELIADFVEPSKKISAIGVGAPGPIDLDNGVFGRLPNLPAWENFDLRKSLSDRFGVPVKIQNDANAAALGEAVYGGGREFDSLYYITLSTGIGGGYIFHRRIVNGASHLTGEIWALSVDNFGRKDILLNSASGPGIVRTALRLMEAGERSALTEIDGFTSADVCIQARQGDPLSQQVMASAARHMARVIASVFLFVDPDIVLLGGGLAAEEDSMINPIRAILPEYCLIPTHAGSRVRRAELWDEAVLYGALALFEEGPGPTPR